MDGLGNWVGLLGWDWKNRHRIRAMDGVYGLLLCSLIRVERFWSFPWLFWCLLNMVLLFSSLSYNLLMTCLSALDGWYFLGGGGQVSAELYADLFYFPSSFFFRLESSFQETGGLLMSQCYYYDMLYFLVHFGYYLYLFGHSVPCS